MSRLTTLAAFLTFTLVASTAFAHCQVPCGIYDDGARVAQMREDAETITKAIGKITQLAGQHDATAFNQAARWVNTKEEHASRIITTVSEYFLTQKVKAPKAGDPKASAHYHQLLADHHAVMKAAMTTKQTVSPAAAHALMKAIDGLADHYTSEKP
jgi:nickel superoxide dismutase